MSKLINKVGEKIKKLRKELNLTQTELAGKEMTKSMLSQIENNISNPSIKTLQYIADKLNKPISYFLEDENNDNKTTIQANEKSKQELDESVKHISELIDSYKIEEAKKELEELIDANTIIKSVKARGDIFFKLGSALIECNNIQGGKKYINLSIEAFTEGNFYIEAAKAYVELAKGFYREFNYKECLSICKIAFELYYKNINTDPLFEIELYYYKILLLSAIGDVKNATKSIEIAINLSTKTSIYYKTDELYRLNAIFNFMMGNKDEYTRNIEKALQFAQFTEDKKCLGKIHTVMAMVALEDNDAEKALKLNENSKYYAEKDWYVYYLIAGRAYYILNKYELAYENIIKVDFPAYETHKFDYLNMWYSKVYEGLILNKLGRQTEAVEAIKFGIEKMCRFDNTKFLVNAYKSLSQVYSDMSDFQNAFINLKKADELQDIINKDKNSIF